MCTRIRIYVFCEKYRKYGKKIFDKSIDVGKSMEKKIW